MNDKLQVTYKIEIQHGQYYSDRVSGDASIIVNVDSLEIIRALDPSSLFKAVIDAAIDDYINAQKEKDGAE